MKELTGGRQYGLISQRIHKIITFLELENLNSKEEALLAILCDLEENMSSEKLMDATNIAKALSPGLLTNYYPCQKMRFGEIRKIN